MCARRWGSLRTLVVKFLFLCDNDWIISIFIYLCVEALIILFRKEYQKMYLIIFLLAVIVLLIKVYAKYKYSYWEKKGVPFLKPTFPIGNAPLSLPKGLAYGLISDRLYHKFKPMACKLAGIYLGLDPVMLILDPRYADEILKKDFSHFTDRGVYQSHKCPITVNIATQNGNDWRNARGKFASLFTNPHMKVLFETFKTCCKDLETHLEKCAQMGSYEDAVDLMRMYNTDIIGSAVFGVECKSFTNPNKMFQRMGKALFGNFPLIIRIQMYLALYYPALAKKIGVANVQSEVSTFFIDIVKDIVEYREKNNVYRKDFLQLLIDMKKTDNLSIAEMAAQTFVFFFAGFDSPSLLASLLLMELGLDQKVQDDVRKEIKDVLKKYNNDLPYEALQEMTLLNNAVQESLRLYPSSSTMMRVCVKDYTFSDTNITIEKGVRVLIPAYSYHRCPEYYTNPLKWDINRFADKNEKHIGYLPFGDGPRNCLGYRFGKMQVLMAIISVLKNYKIVTHPDTKLPIEFDPETFFLLPSSQILLKLEKED